MECAIVRTKQQTEKQTAVLKRANIYDQQKATIKMQTFREKNEGTLFLAFLFFLLFFFSLSIFTSGSRHDGDLHDQGA